MFSLRNLAFAGVAVTAFACVGAAQTVISARSGLVHSVEGEAWIDDNVIETHPGEFPEIKEKSVFRTGEGRAEILLNSGVFLRIGENTSIRMINNRLIDTRVELVSGSAMVEVAELLEDNHVTIVAGEAQVELVKNGLYSFDAEPARLRVFDGQASALVNDQKVEVKDGRMLLLDGKTVTAEKFDSKIGDPLYRWSKRRSEYVAMANLSAAHEVERAGYGWNMSGWRFNPYFGMYTFIPSTGVIYSPFGYSYYSPGSVWAVYRPRPVYVGGGGMGGFGGGVGYDSRGGYVTAPRGTGSVVSSGGPSGGGVSAAPAPSAGGGSVGGGRSGGGAGGGSVGGGRGR